MEANSYNPQCLLLHRVFGDEIVRINIKKPARNEQAESRIEIFTDAISCFDRLSVPFPETELSLYQIHGVSLFCRPAMLR